MKISDLPGEILWLRCRKQERSRYTPAMPTPKIIVLSIAALIAVVWLWGRRKTRKSRPYLELRSKKEQQAFNPLSTTYNPKQYRRKRR